MRQSVAKLAEMATKKKKVIVASLYDYSELGVSVPTSKSSEFLC